MSVLRIRISMPVRIRIRMDMRKVCNLGITDQSLYGRFSTYLMAGELRICIRMVLSLNNFYISSFAATYVRINEQGQLTADQDDDIGYRVIVIFAATLGVVNLLWFVVMTVVWLKRRGVKSLEAPVSGVGRINVFSKPTSKTKAPNPTPVNYFEETASDVKS